ncbi:hypothetical protein BVG19_g5732 [[Candida] boidinii]|nr:hypothetical protein BVG19_g5732 [[Candida] boidinii]OWB54118.1 hypothetical protein B5S27_g5758 [[Candida] boidinii]
MSLEVLYHFKYPPNHYFSPQYPIILGNDKTFENLTKSTDELYIKIKFLKKLDKVDKINIIFSGEMKITYKDDSISKPFDNGVEILTETLSLFNFTQTVFDKHNSTFEKDEILILKHKEFKFPFDKFRLPSSYEFSCPTWELSIRYRLTFYLQRSKTCFPDYWYSFSQLDYQSGDYFDVLDKNLNYLVSNTSLKDTDSHCFKKKPKRFILDKGANLVANLLIGSHRLTRNFRSMFNDNYKKSIYENSTKDVDFILKLKPNSYSFDINDNFVSQLGVLRIETNSISNNILVPDHEINKTSTELGKFHFKYLKIYMIDHLNIHCKGHSSGPLLKKTALIDTLVYKRQHETVSPKFINGYNNSNNTDDRNDNMNDVNDADSNNSSINTADTSNIDSDNNDISISFDLCDFKQDPQNKECYFTELNISELLKNSSSSISFPKPILSSFTMPNHFENEASIEIEIGIDSRLKGESETKIYNFSFGVILTSNLRLPPKVSRYRKKNQYNNDYVTATSKNNSQDQYINNNSYNNTNDVVPQSQPLSNPPRYDDIFDSSEIGNESSNHSINHVAKQ